MLLKKPEIVLARTVFRTQLRIYEEFFFAKIVNSFYPFPQKNLFVDVRQGSKYASGASFVYEIILTIDNFSSKS